MCCSITISITKSSCGGDGLDKLVGRTPQHTPQHLVTNKQLLGTLEGYIRETKRGNVVTDSVTCNYTAPRWCGVRDVSSHTKDRCAGIHMESYRFP